MMRVAILILSILICVSCARPGPVPASSKSPKSPMIKFVIINESGSDYAMQSCRVLGGSISSLGGGHISIQDTKELGLTDGMGMGLELDIERGEQLLLLLRYENGWEEQVAGYVQLTQHETALAIDGSRIGLDIVDEGVLLEVGKRPKRLLRWTIAPDDARIVVPARQATEAEMEEMRRAAKQ